MGKNAKKGNDGFYGDGYNVLRQVTDGTENFKKSFKHHKNSDSQTPVIRSPYFVDTSWKKILNHVMNVLMDLITLLGNRLSLKQQNTFWRLQTFSKAKGWMWRSDQLYVVMLLRKLGGRS